jgi:HK97 family phage major capsid protein
VNTQHNPFGPSEHNPFGVRDRERATSRPIDRIEQQRIARIMDITSGFESRPGVEELRRRAIFERMKPEDVLREMADKVSDVNGMNRGLGVDVNDGDASRMWRDFLVAGCSGHGEGFMSRWGDKLAMLRGKVGGEPIGTPLPWMIGRRDFNVGTSAEAGNLVQTQIIGRPEEALYNYSALVQLGARVLPMRSTFQGNRFNSGVSATVTSGEISAAAETQPLTASVTAAPIRITAFVEPSKQTVLQEPSAVEWIRDTLISKGMEQLEAQAINGAGTGGQGRGIRFTAGIQTTTGGVNGAQLTYPLLSDLESAVANNNGPENNPGFLLNTRTRRWLRTQPRGTGLPYVWEGGERPLLNQAARVTNNVPSNLTKGTSTGVCSSVLYSSDWSRLALLMYGTPDVTVDPFTLAQSGQVRITMNFYAAPAVLLPAAFSIIDDALTA